VNKQKTVCGVVEMCSEAILSCLAGTVMEIPTQDLATPRVAAVRCERSMHACSVVVSSRLVSSRCTRDRYATARMDGLDGWAHAQL
jgi:hypothetical protein